MAKRESDEARPLPERMDPGMEREPGNRRDKEDDIRGLAEDDEDVEDDIDDADLDEDDGA